MTREKTSLECILTPNGPLPPENQHGNPPPPLATKHMARTAIRVRRPPLPLDNDICLTTEKSLLGIISVISDRLTKDNLVIFHFSEIACEIR